ncbi:hypothetical protein HYW61_00950 [candidate division WWE3 bacterium]|nr:hypothetical protein [candidate division WWE3 bacterium]
MFSYIKERKALAVEVFCFLVLFYLLYIVAQSNVRASSFYFKSEDIYYEYTAAKQLYHGQSPYERILGGNLIENDKYVTLLPLYYYLLMLVRIFSRNEFNDFLSNWHAIVLLFQFAGGVFVYLWFRRINMKALGFVAAAFYMFNLWSLEGLIFLKQDAVAIALLVSSLYFFKTRLRLSFFLYGLSLGVKHISIFALPMYLTPIIFGERKFREYIVDVLYLLVPVVAPMASLFLDDPWGFLKSLLFSITRSTDGSKLIFGYARLLVKYDDDDEISSLYKLLLPRLPLFVFAASNVFLLFAKKIPRVFFATLGVLTFSAFNPVIFSQYVIWIFPLAFITVADLLVYKFKS